MAEPQYVRKRRSPRRRLFRSIGFLHRGQYHITESLEISESGILVKTVDDVKVGDHTVVTFAIPGQALIATGGEVRYVIDLESGGQAFGIWFKDLDLSYKRLVRNYVALKSEAEANVDQQKKHKPKTYAYSFDEHGKAKPTTL